MKTLTIFELTNYFRRKWQNNRCPFCGSAEWCIASKGGDLPYIAHSPFQQNMKSGRITDPISTNADFVSFIVIRCENCNHTAYFDYEAIKKEIHDANTTG